MWHKVTWYMSLWKVQNHKRNKFREHMILFSYNKNLWQNLLWNENNIKCGNKEKHYIVTFQSTVFLLS